MVVEGASAVICVQLRAHRFVALDDVEHVAQHFIHHAVRRRTYGGGARIQTHASHLAEQIARAQFGSRVCQVQVHRGIDADHSFLIHAIVRMLWGARQDAGQPAEKSLRSALCFDVRHGRGEEHLRFAFGNVEGRGAILALAANDVALLEAPGHHRVPVEFQKCSRNLLKVRQPEQLIHLHLFTARNHRLDNALVRQRSGGARNHALPAGNAR